MKFRLKQKVLSGVLILVVLGALWQAGILNLPPKLTYALQFLNYKLTQGKIVEGKATIKLDAKVHKQEYSLSCEVAALKMALSVYGINVPESDLVRQLSFDQTPKQGNIWGDPDKGFVGRINGSMPANGYGVYAAPIAELARKWSRAEVLSDKTAEALAAHLLEGRPVIIWGYFGRGQKLSWTTPEGKEIKAINGEHARTIIGFTGDAQGPDGFYLIDPIFGPAYWSTSKLLKNWDALDRMAVVVYPDPS